MKRAIFLDDDDRVVFETILEDVIQRLEWTYESFVLKTTHYHLQVRRTHANLAAGMQLLKGRYAAYFNHRHGSLGHLFFGRYHSELIETEPHHLEVSHYIALNPVRAGLCRRPGDWPWGSYAETIGRRPPRPFVESADLLRIFAADTGLARPRFQAFVEGATWAV
jgi:REP element-mobilizing transposase RayT